MNRKEVAELLPFIQAFAEGKTIEFKDKRFKDEWEEISVFPNSWFKSFEYRIKPEPKYRPFKNADECWAEMKIHHPFGWVKEKERNVRTEINYIHNDGVMFSCGSVLFERMFDIYTFADGTPFGI
mgnify:FL=1|jgi:hypothetical protein|nr:MAG TPA: hypothetical protein [Caudoviricetes sp.]